VKSTKGIGTTFWFLLPFEEGHAVEKKKLSFFSNSDKKMAVLLAEDQPMNQMVATDTLEELFPGISVDIANNGEEAVQMAALKSYDIILMDVHMPQKDGYDATREIRTSAGKNARTPILALTANAVKEEIDKCLAAGMNRHLAKPFDPEKLRSSILELTSESME
jgi:CheY-like chemotaxis protein